MNFAFRVFLLKQTNQPKTPRCFKNQMLKCSKYHSIVSDPLEHLLLAKSIFKTQNNSSAHHAEAKRVSINANISVFFMYDFLLRACTCCNSRILIQLSVLIALLFFVTQSQSCHGLIFYHCQHYSNPTLYLHCTLSTAALSLLVFTKINLAKSH